MDLLTGLSRSRDAAAPLMSGGLEMLLTAILPERRSSSGVERHLLAFVQAPEAGALKGGGMHEHVLAAVVGSDEAVALLLVLNLTVPLFMEWSF